ncbi:hypothetical protein M569_13245, partial [Genlisea aurea]
MGKNVDRRSPRAEQPYRGGGAFICRRCSRGIGRFFSFKCIAVTLFGFAAVLPAIFWVFRGRYTGGGFDAATSVKISARVQSSFKLPKPVFDLIPYIPRLEYDINDEIGVPSFKVAVLSMHEADSCNSTLVVFGFVPDSTKMNSVSLSLLKSSLIDLFLQRCSLLLTSSIFGVSSSFEILKYPGGISVRLEQPASILSVPLFSFTLTRSISDITEHLQQFKEQLQSGLHLMPTEAIYLQTTNNQGSTVESAVVVEASVASNVGSLLPTRLKQLAQVITGTTSGGNLGLNHSVFGNVKGISLSSFLRPPPPPSLVPPPPVVVGGPPPSSPGNLREVAPPKSPNVATQS